MSVECAGKVVTGRILRHRWEAAADLSFGRTQKFLDGALKLDGAPLHGRSKPDNRTVRQNKADLLHVILGRPEGRSMPSGCVRGDHSADRAVGSRGWVNGEPAAGREECGVKVGKNQSGLNFARIGVQGKDPPQ